MHRPQSHQNTPTGIAFEIADLMLLKAGPTSTTSR